MIYELVPSLSYRIWGGSKLRKYKNIPTDNSRELIGETWEVSTHQEGLSKLAHSEKWLSEICRLNYLVKFLDTGDVLSVQVHPDDIYSLKNENQKGKYECWIVLEAEDGAGIYLGFKPGISLEKFKQAISNNENVSEYLNFYRVKPGDFFLVPPGTIHAIGAGITLVEIQQSSGITYRVWDWNRKDKNGNERELHLKKALEVLCDHPEKNTSAYFQHKNIFQNLNFNQTLIEHPDFHLKFYQAEKGQKFQLNFDANENVAVVVLRGLIKINQTLAKAYQSFFILNEHELEINSLEDAIFILIK